MHQELLGQGLHIGAFRGHHERGHRFDPSIVGHPDHRDLGHPGMGVQRILDLSRSHLDPTGVDDVLDAIDDLDITFGVLPDQVTGVEPAITKGFLGGLGVVPVSLAQLR